MNVEEHLASLLQLEQCCFPEEMQESSSQLQDSFEDEFGLGLVLYKNSKVIGCMKGTHINEDNSAEMLATYPDLKGKQNDTFYIDSISILPSERNAITLDFLIHAMTNFLKAYDYLFATAHVRVNTGFSAVLQSRYRASIVERNISHNGFSEPFDYVLFHISDIPCQPYLAAKIWAALRKIRSKLTLSH